MIDHLMVFAKEKDAQNHPVVGQYFIPATSLREGEPPPTAGTWRGDVCIPNIFMWDPADNTTEDGGFGPIIIRTPYDKNWRIMIALPEPDQDLMGLIECELVTDHEAAAAGEPFMLQTTMTDDELMTLQMEPQYMGRNYPPPGPKWLVRKA